MLFRFFRSCTIIDFKFLRNMVYVKQLQILRYRRYYERSVHPVVADFAKDMRKYALTPYFKLY